MTLTVETAIMIETVIILVMVATILIGRLLWKSGGEFVPETMKVLFHATRDWFGKMGWGPDTGARRKPEIEYPNRKEDS